MGVGGALRQVAAFLEECEDSAAVTAVDLVECNEGADRLSAAVELTLSPPATDDGAMSPCATTLNADGTLRLGFETDDPVVPVAGGDVEVDPIEATLTADGEVRVRFSAAVGAVEGAESARADDRSAETGSVEAPETESASGGRDVPPFKDPDLLSEVYESCDTFAEMAGTLEMDVTAETVRRYMIDYDIHEPNSYDTTGDTEEATGATEEEPVVLSDGVGLPDDITVEELIETVKGSNTIYEVKRDMGVDRQDALQTLRDLNLLDLVVGRLATEAERDISRGDVVERLREASADTAR